MSRSIVSGRVARNEYQNLISKPEAFTNAAWTLGFGLGSLTPLDNQVANPIDGNLTAASFTESNDASSLGHVTLFTVTGLTIGRPYVYTAFLKGAGRIDGTVHATNTTLLTGAATTQVFFNLTLGTFTSGSNGSIYNIGNGWWRCCVTGLATATSSQVRVGTAIGGNGQYQGDGRIALYGYGANFNLGLTPAPYLPGQSSTVNAGLSVRRAVSGRVAASGRVPN